MRSFRTVIAAVALAVVASLGLVAPAGAADNDAIRGTVTRAEEAPAALPTRSVSINYKQVGDTIRVRLFGKAQAWKGKKVVLQKKVKGNFKPVQNTKTNSKTRYVFTVQVPKKGKHTWRVRVPKGGGYATSYSKKVTLYWS